jgi:hypothetical protein
MNWWDQWFGFRQEVVAPEPVDRSTEDPRGWFDWLVSARSRYATRHTDDQGSGDGIEWYDNRIKEENERVNHNIIADKRIERYYRYGTSPFFNGGLWGGEEQP